MNRTTRRMEIGMLMFAVALSAFLYGAVVEKYRIFPYNVMHEAYAVAKSIFTEKMPFFYFRSDTAALANIYDESQAYQGLNLVISVGPERQLSAKIIDMQGAEVHRWNVNWFDIWPDASHLPEEDMPKEQPGTHIHGAVLLDNGELVFNYEHLGLVKLGLCGEVQWRLPYRTHHSVHLDESGNLWVSAQKDHDREIEGLTNHKPPFIEPMIIEVSRQGKVLQEISVIDLIKSNNLDGLLYMSSIHNSNTQVSGDTLHLNDVETFPGTMKEGFFKKGDILVSLRNINMVFVFDPDTKKIKYRNIGGYVRQHDPDFVDGDTISVFDNNNAAQSSYGLNSRIVLNSALKDETRVYYEGDGSHRFYSDIMGKHQWLPNGNLLITESMGGRAFEINESGDIVWQYYNVIDGDRLGLLEEVLRLPPGFEKTFNKLASRCGG